MNKEAVTAHLSSSAAAAVALVLGTRLNPAIGSDTLEIRGYNLFRQDLNDGGGGNGRSQSSASSSVGGILVYHSRRLNADLIGECEDKNFEGIWLRFALNDDLYVDESTGKKRRPEIVVGSVRNYMRTALVGGKSAPKSTPFTDYLERCMAAVGRHYPHADVYIHGDFNIANPDWLGAGDGAGDEATAEGVCLSTLAAKHGLAKMQAASEQQAFILVQGKRESGVHVDSTFPLAAPHESCRVVAAKVDRNRCGYCKEMFASGSALTAHRASPKHRRNFCFVMYQKSRDELIEDKLGLEINVFEPTEGVVYDVASGTIELRTTPNVRAEVVLQIKNANDLETADDGSQALKQQGVILKAIDFLTADGSFSLEDQYNLHLPAGAGRHESARSGARLVAGRSYKVRVGAQNAQRGQYRIPLVVQVKKDGDQQLHHIARELLLRVETADMLDLVPAEPYRPPRAVPTKWAKAKSKTVDGLRLEDANEPPQMLKKQVSLEHYIINATVQKLLHHGFVAFDHMKPEERAIFDANKKHLGEGLTADNYAERFRFLLWCEEHQMQFDIRHYDMEGVAMQQCAEDKRLLELAVPGLAENRPSVLRGDKLFVRVRLDEKRADDREYYEGIVHRVYEEKVLLGFGQKLRGRFIPNMKFDVQFTFNRFPLRNCHRAIELTKKLGLVPMLFPSDDDSVAGASRGGGGGGVGSDALDGFRVFNRDIEANGEQKAAVHRIVFRAGRKAAAAPYVIFGPPGTGKTCTMVEAIYQVLVTHKNSHVLATAPSNTAADLLAQRLIGEKYPKLDGKPWKDQIIRLYAPSRSFAEIESKPANFKTVCNFLANGIPFYPSVEELKKKRVIIVTLVTAGRLVSASFPARHFTHVFIDEAGQATEPEAVIPLAGILDPAGGGCGQQLVLAGDPRQLGPVLRSPIAIKYGLGTSLLERLMTDAKLSMYQKDPTSGKYDSRNITKLLKNFRSHESLLTLPSKLFYDGELRAEATNAGKRDIVESLLRWPALPKPGFPLLFHGVVGEDLREAKSPSFFNAAEVCTVCDYVEDLLTARQISMRLEPKDIGIISPYRRQVQKIRKKLEQKLKKYPQIPISRKVLNSMVGSTEEFQGQERRVIIITTVRSKEDFLKVDFQYKLGFLRNPKRFNVAITRAQALMIVVGNPKLLSMDDNWRQLIAYAKEKGGYTGVDFAWSDEEGESSSDMEVVARKFKLLGLADAEKEVDLRQKDISQKEYHESASWRSSDMM